MAKPDYGKALSGLKALADEPDDTEEMDTKEESDPTYTAMVKEVFPDFDDEQAAAFKRLVMACMSED